ncbi:MAG TPA: signal peptide peptidase SppA [Rhizomicrobium sp.]|jgi:protease-4|nr:signal peptide peptidase SppA [Rhizomicrobium sp.]
MVRFLAWLRDVLLSVLNGLAKAVMLVVLVLAVLVVVSLARGDGLPGNMVLALDLREPIDDSAAAPTSILTPKRATVMDVVLGLDVAGRDARVKGVMMRLGNGAISTAEAQEIGAAVHRFRAKGKFVIAQATAFFGAGLGDYLAASAANEIWVQPKSPFSPSGAGGGELFLRGAFDKIHAEPQIAKRAEYKSAADMYMEKEMSPADREQLTVLMTSVYDNAVDQMAQNRHIPRADIVAALQASPQFAEDAKSHKLVDRIGYDDEARAAATARAGTAAKSIKFTDYVKDATSRLDTANIAIVEAAGEIRDGTAKNSLLNTSSGIASDDLSAAIDQAARDKNIKAIVLRVDSPGGSVTASDQILHAVKKAQKTGKPVVVSMGSVAASGGYYISMSANKIVAEPGTITGSIGVLTGKVSFGKSLELVGAKAETVAIGKNTLMDSPLVPFTADQWANLNRQADIIYDDFTEKVAAGRKLPVTKVREVARGRVWSGADANARGLVDRLGGFWMAAQTAAGLASIPDSAMSFSIYPRPSGLLGRLGALSGGLEASLGLFGRVESLLHLPALEAVLGQVAELPDGGPGSAIQLKAAHLPRP